MRGGNIKRFYNVQLEGKGAVYPTREGNLEKKGTVDKHRWRDADREEVSFKGTSTKRKLYFKKRSPNIPYLKNGLG